MYIPRYFLLFYEPTTFLVLFVNMTYTLHVLAKRAPTESENPIITVKDRICKKNTSNHTEYKPSIHFVGPTLLNSFSCIVFIVLGSPGKDTVVT